MNITDLLKDEILRHFENNHKKEHTMHNCNSCATGYDTIKKNYL